MKKILLILLCTFVISRGMAQAQLEFPFQGGKEVMLDFFEKNVAVSDYLKQHAANGLVVMKFTSDQQGSIIKLVVYYADDVKLTQPVISALKATNGRWIVPANEKTCDFVIPFTFKPNTTKPATAKTMFQFYTSRAPIVATDQIPLNTVTLLPAVQVLYDL